MLRPYEIDEIDVINVIDAINGMGSDRRNRCNRGVGAFYHAEVTVKGYVSTLLDKLQVADRTQAALLAVRYGLVGANELLTRP